MSCPLSIKQSQVWAYHYIIINHCFIYNAVSLSQCRRLPYAFCTRPPSLYGILAQSLPVLSQQHFLCCSDWYLVNWQTPKSPSSRLEIRQIKKRRKCIQNGDEKRIHSCLFPLARETISANHKDRLLTNDKLFVDSTHLESPSWHQSH